jgi:hypothetical protein
MGTEFLNNAELIFRLQGVWNFSGKKVASTHVTQERQDGF